MSGFSFLETNLDDYGAHKISVQRDNFNNIKKSSLRNLQSFYQLHPWYYLLITIAIVTPILKSNASQL